MVTIYEIFVMLNLLSMTGLLLVNYAVDPKLSLVNKRDGCVYALVVVLGPLTQIIMVCTIAYTYYYADHFSLKS